MKTLSRLLLLVSPLALGACVDQKVPIEMFGICAPPEADACKFDAECGGFYLGENVIDISTAERLWLFVEVHNQLLSNEDPDIGRVNTNDAFIEEVRVAYRGLNLDPTSHRLQDVVPANGTTVASIFPVTEEALAQLNTLGIVGTADLIASVRLRGILGDTSEFETDAYDIPVRVCDGCIPLDGCAAGDVLITCPPSPITLRAAQGQFPRSAACITP